MLFIKGFHVAVASDIPFFKIIFYLLFMNVLITFKAVTGDGVQVMEYR